MLVQVKVQSLVTDKDGAHVVVLQEVDGSRRLPIWIGPGEAAAIEKGLAPQLVQPPAQPLTHDLLAALIARFGGQLTQVVIRHGGGSLFLADLIVHKDDQIVKLDARPSDAIAVALRSNAEILVYEELLGPEAEG